MKKKVLFIIVVLLTVANINSQTRQLNRFLVGDISHPSKNIKTAIHERLDEYNFTQNFDSTSVVDSVVVLKKNGDEEKYYYIYDGKGRITSYLYIIKIWDGSQLVNDLRWLYNYIDGSKVYGLREKWNGSQWINDRKDTLTYNDYGNLVHELSELWINNQWQKVLQWTYTYNSNGKETLKISEYWSTDKWQNEWRFSSSYDSTGKLLSYTKEEWEGSQWVYEKRYSYTYGSIGNLSLFFSEEWWDDNQWHDIGRIIYSYDNDGNMILELSEYHYTFDSIWIKNYENTFIYDSYGNMVTKLSDIGDGETSYKGTYTYNSDSKIIQWIGEHWKENQWVKEGEYTCTYDLDGNVVNYLSEQWDATQWIGINDNLEFYDSFGRYYRYNDASEVNIYYSTLTDIEEVDLNILDYSLSQNYPNPFNPETIISYQLPASNHVNLKVYDLLGRELVTLVNQKQKSGNYEVIFNAENLPSGVYLYRIEVGNFSDSKKLLLLK